MIKYAHILLRWLPRFFRGIPDAPVRWPSWRLMMEAPIRMNELEIFRAIYDDWRNDSAFMNYDDLGKLHWDMTTQLSSLHFFQAAQQCFALQCEFYLPGTDDERTTNQKESEQDQVQDVPSSAWLHRAGLVATGLDLWGPQWEWNGSVNELQLEPAKEDRRNTCVCRFNICLGDQQECT